MKYGEGTLGVSLERVMHTRAVQIWDTLGNGGDDVLCWQGVQWHELHIPPIWVQKGGSSDLGNVRRTPSADLGKSHWGFAIKHSSNMGVKGHLPHSGDVHRAPSADLGKTRWGFAIMHPCQYGVKGHKWCAVCNMVGQGAILTITGINNRTSSAELNKPWWSF